jgi:hypothetical protein
MTFQAHGTHLDSLLRFHSVFVETTIMNAVDTPGLLSK